MAVDHNNPQSRTEEILIATIDGTEYDKLPQSRLEELLLELKQAIEESGGGGGTTNYNLLSNKPQINGVTLSGEMTASDLSLVLAEVGKGLSTNDYSDEEKAKVADLLTAIEGILNGSDIDSFGDVESALADKVDKVNGKGLSANDFTDTYKDAVDANTTAISGIKDGTDIDSFGDVEVALLDKADTSDLGTAAAKDSTNSVTAGSTDLVESGAVKDAIDEAVAAAYHHAGTKTVAQLTHDLLIAANEGNVYNITDSGTTSSDFIEGIGKKIDAGDNVGICKVGNVYMFDLLSGLEDTSIFVQKSQTSGLLKNDGTVNTTIEDTVAGHTTAIAGKQNTLTFDDTPTDGSNNPVKSNGIYDALALKQNATDNSLQTTDKTVVGAINEHEGDIDTLKSGLTNVQSDVKLNTQDLTTPSRSINLMTLPITITKSGSSTGTVTNNDGVITLNGEFFNEEVITVTCADCIAPNDAIIAYMNNVALTNANISFYNGSTKHDYFSFSIPNRIIYTSALANVVGKTINRYDITFTGTTTLDNFTFSLMMVHNGQNVSTYTPYIPSVESRIEAVESGLNNLFISGYHAAGVDKNVSVGNNGLYFIKGDGNESFEIGFFRSNILFILESKYESHPKINNNIITMPTAGYYSYLILSSPT